MTNQSTEISYKKAQRRGLNRLSGLRNILVYSRWLILTDVEHGSTPDNEDVAVRKV